MISGPTKQNTQAIEILKLKKNINNQKHDALSSEWLGNVFLTYRLLELLVVTTGSNHRKTRFQNLFLVTPILNQKKTENSKV